MTQDKRLRAAAAAILLGRPGLEQQAINGREAVIVNSSTNPIGYFGDNERHRLIGVGDQYLVAAVTECHSRVEWQIYHQALRLARSRYQRDLLEGRIAPNARGWGDGRRWVTRSRLSVQRWNYIDRLFRHGIIAGEAWQQSHGFIFLVLSRPGSEVQGQLFWPETTPF